MTFSPDLQVVILAAGKGSRMPELLSGKPKCLLPIGPKPLIWYTLYKIQSMGFNECIVIVIDNQKLDIQEAVDKCGLHINVRFHTIPHDEDFGTADSLRSVHELIHSDVLLLPCDLLTSINFSTIISKFESEEASLVALYLQPQSFNGLTLPGPKTKSKQEREIIMIDEESERLVYLASTSDYETVFSNQEALSLKYPRHNLYTTLVDSHVLVLKKWIIDYLKSQEAVSTLRGEFFPLIIKKQMVASKTDDEIFNYYKSGTRELYSRFPDDDIRCFAHIATEQDIAVRINTLASFYFMNSKLVEVWNRIAPNEKLVLRSPKADIESSQVDEKCIIWENSRLKEKTSFKNSIIGPNVEVGSFSRIFNCILMKDVIIKERVALENCIISDNTVIESRTQLNSCIVGCNNIIPEDSKHSNEILSNSDRLME
ncbi:translation initiation factor eIF-2B subunit gamma [Coccinella septempunctata]|uniref:translation initiation factor eIF-2B subunit gamma n=1 Tax=Coccinella septempunctata TaxID=41139 RepID=UPI001D089DA1|nr:translation initiation factor eIF-2B subunit gamma [Coccinella septempunctata]XP_044754960.1 translation initiation factor eIF-2B subunit gamma [Coccinella septempunctata]